MANPRCRACNTTNVKKAGMICAQCVGQSASAPLEEALDPNSDAARPQQIIAKHFRQTAEIQKRIQEVMAKPEMLLCSACGMNERIVEQVCIEKVSEWHKRYGAVIGATVPAYMKLKDKGDDGEAVTPEEEREIFVKWFAKQGDMHQLEIIQQCNRLYNAKSQKVG